MGGFLLVGVAGFGINNVITDLGTSTVARVGNEEINSRQFLRAYQRQLNDVAQQIGSLPTAEQARSFNIDGIVMQNLSQNAAMDQMASSFGLGVSEKKLSQMLREDPSFQSVLGNFDPAQFTRVLQSSGLTEAEYFADQSDAARRQQLILSLFGDTSLPQTASALVNRYVADKRTIDYFVLGDTNIETPAAPTEDELAAYLAERQSEFRTMETRNVQMLRLSLADLAASKLGSITDDAIAAEYERTRATLTKAERRTIQQVLLNPEQVAAFEAGLAAATPFGTLVADAGLTVTDLGTLSRDAISDAGLANAAFGLAQGGFAIIDGAAGKRAVYVSAIEAGSVPTLEEAREEIALSLATVAARNDLGNVQDQIEELRAAFRPLTQIAADFGLDLYEARVTSGGTELSVIPNLAAEDQSRVTQAIFKAEQGALTAGVPLAGNSNLWFDLTEIEPARDQTLDEVRDRLVETITAERTNNAILAAQADAVSRLDNGEALADVAASYGLFPQISAPFTRFGSDDGTIDGAVASAVFAGDENHYGSAVSQSGEFIVFAVTDLTPAEGALETTANASLENEVRIGIYADFVTAVRDEAGLRVNPQALAQALQTGQ